MVGGGIAGPLVAAGLVMMVATTLRNAAYEKFPLEKGEEEEEAGGCGGLEEVSLLNVYKHLAVNVVSKDSAGSGELSPEAVAWAHA